MKKNDWIVKKIILFFTIFLFCLNCIGLSCSLNSFLWNDCDFFASSIEAVCKEKNSDFYTISTSINGDQVAGGYLRCQNYLMEKYNLDISSSQQYFEMFAYATNKHQQTFDIKTNDDVITADSYLLASDLGYLFGQHTMLIKKYDYSKTKISISQNFLTTLLGKKDGEFITEDDFDAINELDINLIDGVNEIPCCIYSVYNQNKMSAYSKNILSETSVIIHDAGFKFDEYNLNITTTAGKERNKMIIDSLTRETLFSNYDFFIQDSISTVCDIKSDILSLQKKGKEICSYLFYGFFAFLTITILSILFFFRKRLWQSGIVLCLFISIFIIVEFLKNIMILDSNSLFFAFFSNIPFDIFILLSIIVISLIFIKRRVV